MASIEERLSRLEAESQIRQLVARYCFYLDDRLIDDIPSLFTADIVLRSADGVMNATGIDAVMQQYHGRFDALGAGHHVMHDIQLDFADDLSHAKGRVSGHAELWRNGKMMVAALRYDDIYRPTEQGWKFAERTINFLYYVPVSEYAGILQGLNRNHAYDAPMPADFPEKLPSWQSYATSRGRN